MIIDCHYHLDARVQTLENLLAKMEASEIEKTVIMPTMSDPIPHTPEFLLKGMRFLLTYPSFHGLAKRLLVNFTPEGHVKLPQGVLEIDKDPDNAPVAETIAAHPDKFMGWIFVNPQGLNDPVEEYRKWKDQKGFIGVKAHPFWHQYPPEELMPVAQEAAKDGMPLLIHAGFDAHGEFMPLVNNLPNLKLLLAHTGFPGYTQTWKLIKDHPNIYVDLSADAYVNGKLTRGVVQFLGADRCLFGTDGPYGETANDGWFDNGKIKRRIENLFNDGITRQKLLGENFNKIIS